MERVKTAIIAVCAVDAVRSAAGSIISAARLKNQVMLLLDLLLALTMITPVAQGIKEFSLPDLSEYEITDHYLTNDRYADMLAEEASANIENVLKEQLEAAEINFGDIHVNVNILPDYSISISSVTVTADEPEAAARIIKNCLGYETEVINELDG